MALREAPLAEDSRAIRPGMSGGSYRPLDRGQIDDVVKERMAAGEDLYHLDAGALREIDPDIVLTHCCNWAAGAKFLLWAVY